MPAPDRRRTDESARPSVRFGLRLRPGHPFVKVSDDSVYWTATQSGITISDPTLGPAHYVVAVNSLAVGSLNDDGHQFAWCVRGGAK